MKRSVPMPMMPDRQPENWRLRQALVLMKEELLRLEVKKRGVELEIIALRTGEVELMRQIEEAQRNMDNAEAGLAGTDSKVSPDSKDEGKGGN